MRSARAAVVVLQAIFTYAPFMERFFDTRPVAVLNGLPAVGLGILLFAVLEVEKSVLRFGRQRRARRSAAEGGSRPA